MDELAKQVKGELIRTLIWAAIALGTAIGVFYIVW